MTQPQQPQRSPGVLLPIIATAVMTGVVTVGGTYITNNWTFNSWKQQYNIQSDYELRQKVIEQRINLIDQVTEFISKYKHSISVLARKDLKEEDKKEANDFIKDFEVEFSRLTVKIDIYFGEESTKAINSFHNHILEEVGKYPESESERIRLDLLNGLSYAMYNDLSSPVKDKLK